jgi:hypothetical protein
VLAGGTVEAVMSMIVGLPTSLVVMTATLVSFVFRRASHDHIIQNQF